MTCIDIPVPSALVFARGGTIVQRVEFVCITSSFLQLVRRTPSSSARHSREKSHSLRRELFEVVHACCQGKLNCMYFIHLLIAHSCFAVIGSSSACIEIQKIL